MKYDVLRRHLGDKLYEAGDTREAAEAEVAHLVRNGVLARADAKAEPKTGDKAAPRNANKKAPEGANKAG